MCVPLQMLCSRYSARAHLKSIDPLLEVEGVLLCASDELPTLRDKAAKHVEQVDPRAVRGREVRVLRLAAATAATAALRNCSDLLERTIRRHHILYVQGVAPVSAGEVHIGGRGGGGRVGRGGEGKRDLVRVGGFAVVGVV